MSSSTCGKAAALVRAAVARMGRTSSQTCCLLAIDEAKFRHDCQQHGCDHPADARHGLQDCFSIFHALVVSDGRFDLFVDRLDATFDFGNVAGNLACDRLIARCLQAVFLLHAHGYEIAATQDEQFHLCFVRLARPPAWEGVRARQAIFGDMARIDGVCLGFDATGADEGFDPRGVCAMGGDGKVFENPKQVVLVAAGCLADGEYIETSGIRLQDGLECNCGVFDGNGVSVV